MNNNLQNELLRQEREQAASERRDVDERPPLERRKKKQPVNLLPAPAAPAAAEVPPVGRSAQAAQLGHGGAGSESGATGSASAAGGVVDQESKRGRAAGTKESDHDHHDRHDDGQKRKRRTRSSSKRGSRVSRPRSRARSRRRLILVEAAAVKAMNARKRARQAAHVCEGEPEQARAAEAEQPAEPAIEQARAAGAEQPAEPAIEQARAPEREEQDHADTETVPSLASPEWDQVSTATDSEPHSDPGCAAGAPKRVAPPPPASPRTPQWTPELREKSKRVPLAAVPKIRQRLQDQEQAKAQSQQSVGSPSRRPRFVWTSWHKAMAKYKLLPCVKAKRKRQRHPSEPPSQSAFSLDGNAPATPRSEPASPDHGGNSSGARGL